MKKFSHLPDHSDSIFYDDFHKDSKMINKLIQYLLMVFVLLDIGLHILQMRVESINKRTQDAAWQSCYSYKLPYMQIVGGEVYCGMIYQGNSYFIPLNSIPK